MVFRLHSELNHPMYYQAAWHALSAAWKGAVTYRVETVRAQKVEVHQNPSQHMDAVENQDLVASC